MKILQLNAWGGRLQQQLSNLFETQKPDFICLQEAVSIPDGHGNGFFYTVEEARETLNMRVVFAATMSFNFMRKTAKYGNAILSKSTPQYVNTVFTEGCYVEDYDPLTDDYNIRNLLHASYVIDGKKVNILTHHGHHIPDHKNGDENTLDQCKLIADYIKNLEGRVILTGDFNLSPHSESLQIINTILSNACITYDIITTRTSLTHKKEVCDYIFTDETTAVHYFEVLDDLVSDHAPLLMKAS